MPGKIERSYQYGYHVQKRDVLAAPRAVAVIEEYVPGFVEEKADLLGPVLGMKINMLLKFPQAGFKKEDVADICAKLDALDA